MQQYKTVVKILFPEDDIQYETYQYVKANSDADAFLHKLEELMYSEDPFYVGND